MQARLVLELFGVGSSKNLRAVKPKHKALPIFTKPLLRPLMKISELGYCQIQGAFAMQMACSAGFMHPVLAGGMQLDAKITRSGEWRCRRGLLDVFG